MGHPQGLLPWFLSWGVQDGNWVLVVDAGWSRLSGCCPCLLSRGAAAQQQEGALCANVMSMCGFYNLTWRPA